MTKAKKVQLNLAVEKSDRDFLRRLAAERTLKNPETVHSAAGIAADIISEYRRDLEKEVNQRSNP